MNEREKIVKSQLDSLEGKYDIDDSAKSEISFLKSENELLTKMNQALNNRIEDVCKHEALCRKQNLELWELVQTLQNKE